MSHNGPTRDVSPEKTPSHKKPDPHMTDDPGPPPKDVPYKGNEASPLSCFNFDEVDSKAWGKSSSRVSDADDY